MMQGDSYGLEVTLLDGDGAVITPDVVTNIEITIGSLSKTYKDGQVTFSEDSQKWIFPLDQEETFAFPASRVKAQARVVWANGGVEGVTLGNINVHESISKVVL